MAELLVAHTFESLEEGRSFQQWPLHAILAPWFTIDSADEVMHDLGILAEHQQPIDVIIGMQVSFGKMSRKQRQQNAQMIEPNLELQELHDGLIAVVKRHGTLRSVNNIGEGYNPHVRQQGAKILRPGNVLQIDSMSLIEAQAANFNNAEKTVLKNYSFSSHETTN